MSDALKYGLHLKSIDQDVKELASKNVRENQTKKLRAQS